MIYRSRDEVNEAIASQKATVERIITREADRIETLMAKRQGITTYATAEEFLASLDELIDQDWDEHEVPC